VTKTVTWSVIGVVVVLAAVFAGRLDLGETIPESPLIGRTAADLDLPYLEASGTAPLFDGEADVTVVSFWASWCPPCRAEQPELVAAADALGPDGVRFLAIDSRDTTGAAVSFLDTYGRSEHQDVVVDDDNLASIEFGVWGLPETFFIDGSGTIVGKVSGGIDFITVLDLVEQVRSGESIGERSTGEVYQDR
jgi:cytochrome c biogenesis protein CcmG/thiol:disulfide interchange protein DsbE